MEIAMAFFIILPGVIIYVAGQIIVKIVIDPVQELKRVIADIAFKLIYYSHVYRIAPSADTSASGEDAQRNIAPEQLEQAADEYRKLASMLNAGYRLIPFYAVAKLLFFYPEKPIWLRPEMSYWRCRKRFLPPRNHLLFPSAAKV